MRRANAVGNSDALGQPHRSVPAFGKHMRIRLDLATPDDVQRLVELRAAVAEALTAHHGVGPWSSTSTEKGVLFEMRTSQVFVARHKSSLLATLRLATKKPWAIDLKYFRE